MGLAARTRHCACTRSLGAALVIAGLVAVPIAVAHPGAARADVLQYSGDTTNTGAYSTQTALLPTEVSDPAFGQQYSVAVIGQVFAQPVIAVDGAGHSVLVTATETNDVYGLNPDNQAAAPFWHVNLGAKNTLGTAWPVGSAGTAFPNCTDIKPTVGVTSTPVVDPATHTVYLTSKVPKEDDPTHRDARYFLHALDMTNGSEQLGFPVEIAGHAANKPTLAFEATHALQRPGLVLMNGVVYAAFGSHCDNAPYEGWVVGLGAFGSATGPGVVTMWTDEPNASQSIPCTNCAAGLWMSGVAPASDGPGQLLVISGNGDMSMQPGTAVDGHSPPAMLGQSVIRLTVQGNGSLGATDFFAPQNAPQLNSNDGDVGSGGAVVLPSSFGTTAHPNLLVFVGKDGRVTTLDRSSFGGWSGGATQDTDHVVSRTALNGGTWGRPGVWAGDGGWIYIDHTGGDAAQPLSQGVVALQRSVDQSGSPQFVVRGGTASGDSFGFTSGPAVVTSDASGTMTAVVWVVRIPSGGPALPELIGYDPIPDAGGVLQPLFRAPVGTASKFTSVAVDHGHVYMGTKDGNILGFWSSAPPALSETPVVLPQPVALGTAATAHAVLRASRSVTVTSVSAPAPFAAGAPTPASVTAGNTIDIPITFTPTAAGEVRSQLTVTLSDGSVVRVGLDGTGHNAHSHLNAPPTVDLGSVATGATATGSISVTNSGSDPLTIAGVDPPTTAQFSAGPMPTNRQLLPGEQVAIPVTFQASSPAAYNDRIVIHSNASDSSSTTTVTLSAHATPPAVLAVTPQDVEASAAVGQSTTMSFTVSNTGGTAMTITKSKPPGGGDFTVLTPLLEGTPVAAGQSIQLQVRFTPSIAGRQEAQWTINADAPGGRVTVILGGTGIGSSSPPLPQTSSPLPGYWLAGRDGGIFPYGPGAAGYGSTGATHLNAPVVVVAATPSGHGYWLVASDGGVFPFGDAGGYGSTGNIRLNQPIVGMASTPSGHGYWLVASDGGVFPFGDAAGFGSTGNIRLNQPVVGMASTPSGHGYWLVASDGGMFPFGDAGGYGSTGNVRLNRPIVGMASTRDGRGYWLVASDGGMFPFGDAGGYGSTGSVRLNRPIVGMAVTRGGAGYWLVASDGGVFPFGDAGGFGSAGGLTLAAAVIGMAAVP